ncbi:MAG: response regulator [Burkholderiaceae bacterium]|jgi:CheY-like chemotaxis protein|uniref:response regulator transcription factor n=1 Tax=Hylemonella sp. TaxID=2066020 RepID=UPI000E7FDB29|nr:response regulator [Burkholderiaceae bacterium]HBH40226.1 two-component system response regulator [Curvibacter sp.]|tara:strand:+ start:498 stop:872 length:375 start_codon:yes stop_codon:yes gene_type:complete
MKRNALIVDDQPDIRKLILMTMESEDFALHEADNGVDALRLAQNLRPAVMLLDVMMPGGLDGYQVCEKIKSDEILKHQTKVILLTARGQRTDIERGQAAGCDAYLVKPFSPIELLDTVDRLVAR